MKQQLVSTDDLALWAVIRKSTEAMSFAKGAYGRFVDMVLGGGGPREDAPNDQGGGERTGIPRTKRPLPYGDPHAYLVLKAATEAFVMVHSAVTPGAAGLKINLEDLEDLGSGTDGSVSTEELEGLWTSYLTQVNGNGTPDLPYLALVRQKLMDAGLNDLLPLDESADLPMESVAIVKKKLTNPCLLELIWSYWHEEGMLVQTMDAVSRRFQHRAAPGTTDPLAKLEIDPLRPLNNLLWGYIQDEQHRLTVARRAYEYDHHYGLALYREAGREPRHAGSRDKFPKAYHTLLTTCSIFFKQADDTTVVPDGFPVLNALKEVHLLLSEGAHNQFGDLPSTARIEMLMQQWLLARPELREFLPNRIMPAYPEPWMDRVDVMKKIQGWTDVSVLHFRDLAALGEQILLGIRYGPWRDIRDPARAASWARFWRPEIQGYLHAYRAVTGVDLATEATGS